MAYCPRCGQNHYDMTRPTVPTCPFKPQRTGPGGLADPDIVSMARLAQHDERFATGALYGALADEVEKCRAALREAERFLDYFANGHTVFVGAGTPRSALAQVRAALPVGATAAFQKNAQ